MTFEEYDNIAAQTAVYPHSVEGLNGLEYIALGLCGESGEFADKLKKILRDKGGVLSDEDRYAMVKELGDVLWYLSRACHALGYSLKDAASMNADKLASRKERGTLGGSGDNR